MKPKEGSGSNFEQLEPGNYVARCYQLIHLGKVDDNYQGTPRKTSKVWIGFELPTETVDFKEGEGEKPYAVNKEFTNSSSEKGNLFKFMSQWIPKITKENFAEFDLNYVMGEPCMLTIGQRPNKKDSSKVYLEIKGIGPIPKGIEVPPAFNPQYVFDIDDGFDQEKFNQLPKFMRDKMVTAEEFKALNLDANEVERIAAEVRGETREENAPIQQSTPEQQESAQTDTPAADNKKGNFF